MRRPADRCADSQRGRQARCAGAGRGRRTTHQLRPVLPAQGLHRCRATCGWRPSARWSRTSRLVWRRWGSSESCFSTDITTTRTPGVRVCRCRRSAARKRAAIHYWDGMPPRDGPSTQNEKGTHANAAETSAVLASTRTWWTWTRQTLIPPSRRSRPTRARYTPHSSSATRVGGDWATKSGTWGDARQSTPDRRAVSGGQRGLDNPVLENIEKTFHAMLLNRRKSRDKDAQERAWHVMYGLTVFFSVSVSLSVSL